MIALKSTFSDYYDIAAKSDSEIVYNRVRQGKGRAAQLNYLKGLGIKTVDFGPLTKFNPDSGKLVVYTNTLSHDFQGKKICTYSEAAIQYPNYLMAQFLDVYNGYTIKYLQVGERRFRVMLQNKDYLTRLVEGSVLAIEELDRQFNYAVALPIYSIDYISNGTEMVAIDFNEVQNLGNIGFNRVMGPVEVTTEIEKALIAYNKT